MASCLKGNSTGFSLLGLREVIPDQTGVEQWKELLLNTGNCSRLALLRQPKRWFSYLVNNFDVYCGN